MLLLVNFQLFHGIFTNFFQLFFILLIYLLLNSIPIFFSLFFDWSISLLWSWICESLVVEFIYWSLCNFQLWTIFSWSWSLLFFVLSRSMLLVISVDSSFVHICSINKNISFSWLDFIFGIILNGWLEHLLILIKILGAFRFLNVILVDLWFISWIFNLLLIMLGLLGILSRNLIILGL